jgi:Ser/Thr protein kinase RdoA (MazF antagonist)
MYMDGIGEGDTTEVPLAGGNVSASVVRVGATVRKPACESTAAVEALLSHLAAVGFTGAPQTLGRDGRGRLMLEYVPGNMADAMPSMTLPELARVGRLIRELHDAAASFVPPTDAAWDVVIPPDREELICHHDLAPWNLVRQAVGVGERDAEGGGNGGRSGSGSGDEGGGTGAVAEADASGERWVFIDWDGAGPGTREWDLAYAAHGFVPLAPNGDPLLDAPRLRALVDGYGLDERQRDLLPELIVGNTRGMYELLLHGRDTGAQPWARLWDEGHGEYWRSAAAYVEAHLPIWRSALVLA